MFTSVQPGWLTARQPARSAGNKHEPPFERAAGSRPRPAGAARPYSRGMPDIHAARRSRIQDQAAAIGADAALITSGVNVRYLTGLASSNAALLLPVSGTAVLATDSRYAPVAQRDCPDLELVTDRFTEPALAAR